LSDWQRNQDIGRRGQGSNKEQSGKRARGYEERRVFQNHVVPGGLFRARQRKAQSEIAFLIDAGIGRGKEMVKFAEEIPLNETIGIG